jgi:hypothetical protein
MAIYGYQYCDKEGHRPRCGSMGAGGRGVGGGQPDAGKFASFGGSPAGGDAPGDAGD